MQSNKVFNRTRIHLATCYGIAIGSIVSLSSYAVYCIMTHAFDHSLRQQLENTTQVDAVHHALEAVLVTPGVVGTLCSMMFFGVPLLILLIAATSWWLAWLAMGPVRQSHEKMQQFTADAAHELRTPLTVARTALESSIASPTLDPEIGNYLQIVQRQITNLSRLSQELLWLSRSTSEECKTEPEPCCMNDLVNDLGDELFGLAMEKNIDLQIHVPNNSIYVIGCSDQLYRAIANLIDNAIQYTERFGIIRVTLSTQEQRVIITIIDNGIGMLPKDLFRIFDRFYRVQSTRSIIQGDTQSKYASGTGLGLPIVQAVLQSHRGTVQVKSQIGKGSIFTVQLPLQR
jgi:signal transduction histidine kinase